MAKALSRAHVGGTVWKLVRKLVLGAWKLVHSGCCCPTLDNPNHGCDGVFPPDFICSLCDGVDIALTPRTFDVVFGTGWEDVEGCCKHSIWHWKLCGSLNGLVFSGLTQDSSEPCLWSKTIGGGDSPLKIMRCEFEEDTFPDCDCDPCTGDDDQTDHLEVKVQIVSGELVVAIDIISLDGSYDARIIEKHYLLVDCCKEDGYCSDDGAFSANTFCIRTATLTGELCVYPSF